MLEVIWILDCTWCITSISKIQQNPAIALILLRKISLFYIIKQGLFKWNIIYYDSELDAI